MLFLIHENISNITEITSDRVRPYPKASPRKNKKTERRKGKTRILIDFPEKLAILEATLKKIDPKQTKKDTNARKIKVLQNIEIVICNIFCKASYCNSCKGYFHKVCIPKSHRIHIPNKKDNDVFLCHNCFVINVETDSDSVNSEVLHEFIKNKNK